MHESQSRRHRIFGASRGAHLSVVKPVHNEDRDDETEDIEQHIAQEVWLLEVVGDHAVHGVRVGL